MSYAHAVLWTQALFDTSSQLIKNTVYLLFAENGVTPAVVYANKTKSATINTTTNPLTTDSFGNAKAWVDPGIYWAKVATSPAVEVEVSADPADLVDTPTLTSALATRDASIATNTTNIAANTAAIATKANTSALAAKADLGSDGLLMPTEQQPSKYGIWRSLGEVGVGGFVVSLAISPHDPNRIVVGGDILGAAVSADGGDSWNPGYGMPTWECSDFTWHPTKQREVWMGSLGGPLKSIDGGANWVVKRTGMPTPNGGGTWYTAPTAKVLFDPTDPTNLHMWAAFGNAHGTQSTAFGTNRLANLGSIYESTDGGDSWTLRGGVGTDIRIGGFAVSTDGVTMIAACPAAGIMRSTDAGQTWAVIPAGTGGIPTSGRTAYVVSHPVAAGTFWMSWQAATATNVNGVYKSTDGGATWTRAAVSAWNATSTTVGSLAVSADGNTLIAGNEDNDTCYKTTDGGTTWTAILTNAQKPPATSAPAGVAPRNALSIDPQNANHFIVGSSDELYRTNDGGATWDSAGSMLLASGGKRGRGYTGYVSERVRYHPAVSGLIFLCGFDNGNLLRTADYGKTWTKPTYSFSSFNGAYDVCFGGAHGQYVYVLLGQQGTFRAIGRSSDYGQTFNFTTTGLPSSGSSMSNSRAAIACTSYDGQVVVATVNGKIYKSTDGGATWSIAHTGAAWMELVVDRRTLSATGSTTVLYACDPSATLGVYKSTDGGTTWLPTTGTPTNGNGNTMNLSIDRDSGTLYMANYNPSNPTTNAGLWKYDGATWTRIFNGVTGCPATTVRGVAVDPFNPNRLLMVTDDITNREANLASGTWLTTDGGTTWAQYAQGLGMTRCKPAVAWDPFYPGRAIVGLNGRGFYFTRFPTLTSQYDHRKGEVAYTSLPVGTGRFSVAAGDDARLDGAADVVNRLPIVELVNVVAASGTSEILPDVTSYTMHDITLTANCTLTFPPAGRGKSFTVRYVQDATGGRTITHPSNMKYASGVAPVLSTGAGKIDWLTYACMDGTNWVCLVAGLDMR